MNVLYWIFIFIPVAGCAYLGIMWAITYLSAHRAREAAESTRVAMEKRQRALEDAIAKLRGEVARLAKWSVVADADDKARSILEEARAALAQAEADAKILVSNAEDIYARRTEEARSESAQTVADAREKAARLQDDAKAAVLMATARSTQIVADANAKAETIAGKAYDAVRNAERYQQTALAMKNIIEGYGDAYLVPAESLLDDLAKEFSHRDAGKQLKIVRDHAKAMINDGMASRCEYVEANRREGAERFVLDAFNGKVDSILSRVKHDNAGILEQEIKDAFTIVNYGGKAFRDARITDEYLAARIQELKWATIAQELKRQEQEEQRRIKEQIREEEKARREYERAIREAAKEEELLRNAMAKAQAQIATATEDQKAKYEAHLAELNAKLLDAEQRNQRALSMAQQTRRGHVYIISNIGSFGDNLYKIGLTRRLEPLDRIKELGDASVPFGFEVHAMIFSEDAPALEGTLHKHFLLNQVNKVNHRKEFFRASLSDIRSEIESIGIDVKWTMAAEAREYRETLAIERAIESDPVAREAWIRRQLVLDPVDSSELSAVEEE